MKKEQVKGCGSVNRPTPSSQRPAEPVATGFSRGVKISKIRGRFWSLGVKLWVVDAGFSQCRAIPYGVTIGVAAIFEEFPASGRIDCSPGQKSHIWERKSSPISSALRRVPHLKNCGRVNKEQAKGKFPAQGRCKTTKRLGAFSLSRLEYRARHRSHISGSVGG